MHCYSFSIEKVKWRVTRLVEQYGKDERVGLSQRLEASSKLKQELAMKDTSTGTRFNTRMSQTTHYEIAFIS